jgi:hypothetical protein
MSVLASALAGAMSKGQFKKKKAKKGSGPTPAKAAEILHDGTANGKPLTDKQRRFMGFKAGGGE